MKEIFKFKQFEVNQRGCTMKINTDGVLLAVKTDPSASLTRVLDIGTGTGVIALMLAQSFPLAHVDAIDIDEGAFHCARLNFGNSPFSERLQIHHTAIEDYASDLQYDLILSNPPFFINSLKNANERKTLSRHASLDFYKALFEKCSALLTTDGSFQIIWPMEIRDQVLHLALSAKLYLNQETYISSFPDSSAFRVISIFKKIRPKAYQSDKFNIYQEQGVYSEAYLKLLSPFFIKYS